MASKADFTIISNGATFEVESGNTNWQGIETSFTQVEVETKRDVLTSRDLGQSFYTLAFKIYKNAEISGIEILDPSNTLSRDAGTGETSTYYWFDTSVNGSDFVEFSINVLAKAPPEPDPTDISFGNGASDASAKVALYDAGSLSTAIPNNDSKTFTFANVEGQTVRAYSSDPLKAVSAVDVSGTLLQGGTAATFTEDPSGDFWALDVDAALFASYGENMITVTPVLEAKPQELTLKNGGADSNGVIEVWNPDGSFNQTVINGQTKTFDFPTVKGGVIRAKSNANEKEVTGVDVEGDLLSGGSAPVFVEDASGDYWETDITQSLFDSYGLNTITFKIALKADTSQIPFNYNIAGSASDIRAELWNGGAKVEDIPLNTDFHSPYDDVGFGYDEIRLYAEAGKEILSVDTSGETTSPFQTPAEFQVESGGAYWYLVLDGVVVDKHAENLMTFTPDVFEETTTISPFNRLHLLDEAETRQLSKVSMEPLVGFETKYVDRSLYIINLLWLPFKLPSDLVGDPLNIKLGDYETAIPAPVVQSDSLLIDLGSIEVPNGESSLDYEANSFELFLPFLPETVELEPSQVLGKVVSVEYVIDAYDGALTVNVYNGEPLPIVTQTSSIGRLIPIKTMNTVEGSFTSAGGADNNTFTAYIRQTKREVLESDYTNLVLKTGALTGLTGYVEVENVTLDFRATSEEKAAIETMLMQGVTIND